MKIFGYKIDLKEIVLVLALIGGLIVLYGGTAVFSYPYDTISLFAGYAIIIIVIALSIKKGS
jgi:uncharacterized membrane protein YccC